MKKEWQKALFFWGLALLILFAINPIAKAENLYDSVIRIHVIANSDDARDQELKLLVRDGLLEYVKNTVPLCRRSIAESQIEARRGEMKAVAEEILRSNGSSDPVSVSLTKEAYPTREYESISLPAGQYHSLQVKIGQAEGKNWWCVLFPPLCLDSATDTENALLSVGMEEENVKTLRRDGKSYQIRFKILELWDGAKTKFKDFF